MDQALDYTLQHGCGHKMPFCYTVQLEFGIHHYIPHMHTRKQVEPIRKVQKKIRAVWKKSELWETKLKFSLRKKLELRKKKKKVKRLTFISQMSDLFSFLQWPKSSSFEELLCLLHFSLNNKKKFCGEKDILCVQRENTSWLSTG